MSSHSLSKKNKEHKDWRQRRRCPASGASPPPSSSRPPAPSTSRAAPPWAGAASETAPPLSATASRRRRQGWFAASRGAWRRRRRGLGGSGALSSGSSGRAGAARGGPGFPIGRPSPRWGSVGTATCGFETTPTTGGCRRWSWSGAASAPSGGTTRAPDPASGRLPEGDLRLALLAAG